MSMAQDFCNALGESPDAITVLTESLRHELWGVLALLLIPILGLILVGFLTRAKSWKFAIIIFAAIVLQILAIITFGVIVSL